jgi:methyl-accepting chemotaxis protein
VKSIFRNIKTKLILAFAFILIIPALSVGLLGYLTAKEAVRSEILDGIEENINLLNTSINNTIETKIHDMDIFSERMNKGLYQEEKIPALRQELDQYIQLHPEAEGIFVGTESGLTVMEPNVKLPDDFDPRTRDWYKAAMENKGETVISDPYISAGSDNMIITLSKAAKDGSGVIGVDIQLNYIQQLAGQVKIGEEGYALILDKNKAFIAHPTDELGREAKESFYDDMYRQQEGQLNYEIDGQDKIMSFVTNKLTGWKIGGNFYLEEISTAAAPIFQKTWIIILIAVVLGAGIIFFIIKSIIKPIKELKEKTLTISKGDLTQKIEVRSNDEIGQLGKAFNDMQASLKILVQEVERHAEQVAASAEELTASADQTASATQEVAASIQEVAGNAEKQTTGIDQNAQSMDEVSDGVTQIAGLSMKVSELSRQTTRQAEEGGKAVSNTVNQMNSIHKAVMESNVMIRSLYERSREVSSILDVITGIAEQTNLLSLNAAIEAARAGEHGKGFAVVADEVRKLAEQSRISAKEISEIIQGIQQDTENSVQIMARVTDDVQTGVNISQEAIEKFRQIVQSAKEMTPQMEEVSASAQEISAAIQEVTVIANELASIAQGNAATSEEVAASTEEQLASMEEISASSKTLSSMAEELNELIARFKY